MAILKKCSSCKRKDGYASSEKDKICARCKAKRTQPRLEDEDNKLTADQKMKAMVGDK